MGPKDLTRIQEGFCEDILSREGVAEWDKAAREAWRAVCHTTQLLGPS